MTENKKIKIHVKNNHWAPGSFPTDAEGEKNFTITKEHLNEALKEFPEINNFDQVTENSGKALKVTKLGDATFKYAISDHYLTNPIARASEVMAELSKNTKERAALAVAAE